jgi:hypothetical protein
MLALQVSAMLAPARRALAEAGDGPSSLPVEKRATGSDTALELDDVRLEGKTEGRRLLAVDARWRLEGLVLLHLADGLGLGGQLRYGHWGLRASVGYQPLLFLIDDDPGDQTFGAFEFSNSAQLNVDTLLLFGPSESGVSLGYRYNTLLGHGAGVAYQTSFDLWSQRFAFSIPLLYFPEATARVRREFGLSSQYDVNFPFGAGIQYGVGVAWML